ncbi:MAG: hypothetical protein H6773_02495 [Pseudomonadales bacterium]|nr:hypothetical protein [Candidatus Woesebacteria bacterium]MCB9801024.1 hypothetical protein [Pseudomonadales bacterium]
MKDYTFKLPVNTSVSDLTVVFTNDYYNPDTGQNRTLEFDYLKIGNKVYLSEVVATYSNGSCGGRQSYFRCYFEKTLLCTHMQPRREFPATFLG